MQEQEQRSEKTVPVYEAKREIDLYILDDGSFLLSSKLPLGENFSLTGPTVALTTTDQYKRPVPYRYMVFIQNGTKAGWARDVQIKDAIPVNLPTQN